MTWNKDLLSYYQIQNGGAVTHGDGVKDHIVSKGTLNDDGMPKITNILHVDSIKVNLVSTSQL